MWIALRKKKRKKRCRGKRDENGSDLCVFCVAVRERVCAWRRRQGDQWLVYASLSLSHLESKINTLKFNWVSEMKCRCNMQHIDFLIFPLRCLSGSFVFKYKQCWKSGLKRRDSLHKRSGFEQGIDSSPWICFVIAKHRLNRAVGEYFVLTTKEGKRSVWIEGDRGHKDRGIIVSANCS